MSQRSERSRLHAYADLLRARWSLSAALATLSLGVFAKLTAELRAGSLQVADQRLLDSIIAHRVRAFDAHMLELTALGSGIVLTLLVAIALFFIALARDYRGGVQLLVSSLGSGLCTELLKRVIERERPDALHRLAEVTSFSFPSGHSLASAATYLALALVLAPRWSSAAARRGAFVLAIVLTLVIGFSRAYIGVHYPGDIAAGLAFGWSWALLIDSAFSFLSAKAGPLEFGPREGD